jgi:hypothetical protein
MKTTRYYKIKFDVKIRTGLFYKKKDIIHFQTARNFKTKKSAKNQIKKFKKIYGKDLLKIKVIPQKF